MRGSNLTATGDISGWIDSSHSTVVFGVIWVVASVAAGSSDGSFHCAAVGGSASRRRRTYELAEADGSHFPLPVVVHNEIGDLIETFNRMVASLAEQRAGLNDTLSLLDSMLANAPIGLAFVDRNGRFVRVNQVFAELDRSCRQPASGPNAARSAAAFCGQRDGRRSATCLCD